MEFADAVVATRWRKHAKHRSVLHGLHAGRDEEVMALVERPRRSPVLKSMLCVIQPDSVYTAARSHLGWGFEAGCPLCGAPIGTWQHYIDDGAGASSPPEPHIAPATLRYNRNVPKHWVEPTTSAEMQADWVDAHRDWYG